MSRLDAVIVLVVLWAAVAGMAYLAAQVVP